MQCEVFRANTAPGPNELWIADCGLRIDAVFNLYFMSASNKFTNPQSAIRNPQSALWPPACVRVRTETTKGQYGYYKTETGSQEEHQEGSGSPGEGLKKRGGSNGDTIPES